MSRSPLRRLADWWERRRGRRSRILDALGGHDDGADGAGVREPRRPRVPSLSGAVAVDEPSERTDT